MPHSRHRHKHSHRHPAGSGARHTPKRRKLVGVLSAFMTFFGLGIAFLAVGNDPIWLLAGALGGFIFGFLLGRFIDRSTQKQR